MNDSPKSQPPLDEDMLARLAAIVEFSHDAVISKDLRGIAVSWNAAAEQLYGYTAAEMIGQPVKRLYPPEREEEEDRILDRIRAGEKIEHYETSRLHKNGSVVEISMTVSPVRDARGRIIGASSVAREIGERRRQERALRENEERYRSLVEAAGGIVYGCDPEARWIVRNAAWEAFTGMTFEEYQGYGWAKAIHPDDRERIQASVANAIATKTTWEAEGRLWHAPSKTYRHQEARSVPILNADGSIREWIGTAIDIHARKSAEEALADTDRRKDEFLAVLAHELRNPLAPIASALQILRMPQAESSRGGALDVMERQVHHLVRLVDDLMEVARITRGTIDLRKELLAIEEPIRAAVEINRELIQARGHRFDLSLPDFVLRVNGDRVRLTQVIANLLNNAAKYTPRNGSIRLAARRADQEVLVSVSDNGAGIAADARERIFEMFVRAGGVAERFAGGLGIGLSLARRLAELHGGTVAVSSAGEGKGSTFTLRLPAADVVTLPPDHAGTRAGAATSRRVLVVDDNRDAATTLAALLGALEYEVHCAYDGDEALRVANRVRPDVLMLDLGMPPPDGFEVARRIRAEPWGAKVKIVAVTGWGQQADRARSREAGFDLHLVKPLALADIQTALAK